MVNTPCQIIDNHLIIHNNIRLLSRIHWVTLLDTTKTSKDRSSYDWSWAGHDRLRGTRQTSTTKTGSSILCLAEATGKTTKKNGRVWYCLQLTWDLLSFAYLNLISLKFWPWRYLFIFLCYAGNTITWNSVPFNPTFSSAKKNIFVTCRPV